MPKFETLSALRGLRLKTNIDDIFTLALLASTVHPQ